MAFSQGSYNELDYSEVHDPSEVCRDPEVSESLRQRT
jgi:hypothetical protein